VSREPRGLSLERASGSVPVAGRTYLVRCFVYSTRWVLPWV